MYSFFYQIAAAQSGVEYQLITLTPSTSYDGALLPQGGGNASTIIGHAYIEDQPGASSSVTDTVVCEPQTSSVNEHTNRTNGLLNSAFASGDVERVFQTMVSSHLCDMPRSVTYRHHDRLLYPQVASASVVNLPNCSLDCSARNRETCSVDELCGNCLDGFVGAIGPSREACSAPRRRAMTCANGVIDRNETETDLDCGGQCAPCAVGATCKTDADCAYGLCVGAAIGLGTCGMPTKRCPTNCTGHGVCEYADITGARIAARDCPVDRWSCSAICACAQGFHGDACSLDAAAYEDIASLRSTLIDSLGMATTMQDSTAQAMNAQASSLASLTAKPAELRGTAHAAALGLATGIAETSGDVGLVGGTASSLGISLSKLCETTFSPQMNSTADANASSTTMTPTAGRPGAGAVSLMRATNLLSTAQLAKNVAGEDPRTIDTDNLMMTSQRAYASAAASAVLSPPVNGDSRAPTVMIGAAALAYARNGSVQAPYAVVDTQWQQWGVNLLQSINDDVATTSPLVSLYITPDADDGNRHQRRLLALGDDDAAGQLPELTFVLNTLVPIDYSRQSSSVSVNLTCAAGFVGRASAACPLTNATVHTNCTGDATGVQITCATKGLPTCLRWDSRLETFEADSCYLRNFSGTNVTCTCDTASFVAPALAGGLHFTSGSEQLLLFFASTFQPPGGYGLSLFTQNALLMYTFAFLATYAVLSFLIGRRADSQDRIGWADAKDAARQRNGSDPNWKHTHSTLPPFMHKHCLCHLNVTAIVQNHPCVRLFSLRLRCSRMHT